MSQREIGIAVNSFAQRIQRPFIILCLGKDQRFRVMRIEAASV